MKMADEMKWLQFRKEDIVRPKEKIIIIKKPNNLYTIFDVLFFAGFYEKKGTTNNNAKLYRGFVIL